LRKTRKFFYKLAKKKWNWSNIGQDKITKFFGRSYVTFESFIKNIESPQKKWNDKMKVPQIGHRNIKLTDYEIETQKLVEIKIKVAQKGKWSESN